MPRCDCGRPLKPDVVLFGEMLDEAAMNRASALAAGADLMLCIGSSLEVWPVAELPEITLTPAARVAIVTQSATPYDGHAAVRLDGDVVDELEAVLAALLAPARYPLADLASPRARASSRSSVELTSAIRSASTPPARAARAASRDGLAPVVELLEPPRHVALLAPRLELGQRRCRARSRAGAPPRAGGRGRGRRGRAASAPRRPAPRRGRSSSAARRSCGDRTSERRAGRGRQRQLDAPPPTRRRPPARRCRSRRGRPARGRGRRRAPTGRRSPPGGRRPRG